MIEEKSWIPGILDKKVKRLTESTTLLMGRAADGISPAAVALWIPVGEIWTGGTTSSACSDASLVHGGVRGGGVAARSL